MDRITKMTSQGAWYNSCGNFCNPADMEPIEVRQVLERLCEYEEIGLTPKEVMQLKEYIAPLEKLPCSIGDTVYQQVRCSTKEAMEVGIMPEVGWRSGDSKHRRNYVFKNKRPWKIVERKMCKSLYKDFGETVFLTREEAEADLEKYLNENPSASRI